MTKVTKNPILEEIHAVRKLLLADAGGTLDALVDRLQAKEQQSDRPKFKPRQTTPCNGAVKSGVSALESPLSPHNNQ